jgi:hypothetical protein
LFVSLAFPITLSPEGCGPILKELFQPAVKDGGLKLLFLAKVGYRYLLNQMPAKDGDFLVRGVMLAMLDHGVPSVSLSYYTAEHSISNWGKTLFFLGELEQKIRRESMDIPLDCLIQLFGTHPVYPRQIGIKDDLPPSKMDNNSLNSFDRN